MIPFWGNFAEADKALLANKLVLTRRVFAAVLGILDRSLTTAA